MTLSTDLHSSFHSSSSHINHFSNTPQGTHELGFFNPGNPNKIYLGIWFKNIPFQNIVWVANGGNPMNDSSAILKLDSSSNLVLTQNNMTIWSTKYAKEAQNPVVQLLDSGNLVIRDQNGANPLTYLWQSFDYPSNTMVAGMKIGWDLKRNFSIRFFAWKCDNDPTPGDLYWGVVLYPYPDICMMKGTSKCLRVGPWNGLSFSGRPDMKLNPVYHYEFVSNKDEVYYRWTLKHFRNAFTRCLFYLQNLEKHQREMELDEPKRPGVFTKKDSVEASTSSSCSTNAMTISLPAR
ncbi:hypothetical protein VNO78_06307 [Psophocarpus tetragonolobus]|uniref:Bulb-type lectin domain-containing protein n=1 Tax=Psophocarpus tetragonolobus TaxID=3891 RepID=A0AAN9XS24_PSOTE